MGNKNIVVVRPIIDDDNREKIDEIAKRYGYNVSYFTDNKEAVDSGAVGEAEIIYGSGPKLVKHSPKLKWFCSAAAGVNNILVEGLAASPDYILTCATGAYGLTIAEHIIMVSLMMMRKMPAFMETNSENIWAAALPQDSIADSSILVLGTGDIGGSFADRARAFKPREIIGINRTGVSGNSSFDRVDKLENLDSYIPEADLIVLCLPETPATVGLMSRERLSLIKSSAYLVNVGRGTAIDQQALMDILNDGGFAGAALDVFQREPLSPLDPIWKTKNLLITPHVSGQESLKSTRDRNVAIFCNDLINYCEGKPLKNLVDPELGYKKKDE